MNRNSDHDELQREAQAAQARNIGRKQDRQDEMKAPVFNPRQHQWTKAFELLALQGLALVYTALGVLIGFGVALLLS